MSLRRAMRVWLRQAKVFTKLYKSSITLNFVEPLLYLTAMGMGLGVFIDEINGVPYINFIAPGIVAYSSMFAASAECTYGTFVRMTFQKTFDAILTTPVNLDDLVLGEMLWGATKSLLYGSIIIVTISVMGLVDSAAIVLAVPALLISGFIFAEIAVIYTSFVPGIDYFNYYFTLVITPMFLFSGVFFPVESFSPAAAHVANLTPLFHLVKITRGFARGDMPWGDVAWLVVIAALLFPLPFRLMRRRLMK